MRAVRLVLGTVKGRARFARTASGIKIDPLMDEKAGAEASSVVSQAESDQMALSDAAYATTSPPPLWQTLSFPPKRNFPGHLPWWESCIAGGLAGITAHTVVTLVNPAQFRAWSLSTPPNRESIVSLMTRILREEGLLGFWRGSLRTIHISSYRAVQLGIYDQLRPYTLNQWGQPAFRGSFITGAISGASAVLLLYPLAIAHREQRLCNRSGEPWTGFLTYVNSTIQRSGTRGLYRGVGLSVLSKALWDGSTLATYEALRRLTGNGASPLGQFVCGVVALVFAQSVAYPFDTVRRRVLALPPAPPLPRVEGGASWRASTTRMVLERIVREEGVLGLYRGSVLSLAKNAPIMGLTLVFWEQLKRGFQWANNKVSTLR